MFTKGLVLILVNVLVHVHGWSSMDRGDKSYIQNKLEKSVDYTYYKNAGQWRFELQFKTSELGGFYM